jgi:hypothetical protein
MSRNFVRHAGMEKPSRSADRRVDLSPAGRIKVDSHIRQICRMSEALSGYTGYTRETQKWVSGGYTKKRKAVFSL